MNDGFPPIYGHNRWINPAIAPDDQDTVRFTDNPLGLAATMSERAADSGHDTATIHTTPFLRREAGGWQILALATVVLGMLIGAPVAYSVMTPTGSPVTALPSAEATALPLEVAPLPTAAPTTDPSVAPSPSVTPTAGPAGPQGPAGVTTVIYVPVRASASVSIPKPKPKPTVDPYAKYEHGSACGSYTQYSTNHHDGRDYKFAWSYFGSPGHWTFSQVPASCPEWSQHTPPNN